MARHLSHSEIIARLLRLDRHCEINKRPLKNLERLLVDDYKRLLINMGDKRTAELYEAKYRHHVTRYIGAYRL